MFTVLFFVEMLLRMYGLGFHGYFRSSFNKYDFVVSFYSIIFIFSIYLLFVVKDNVRNILLTIELLSFFFFIRDSKFEIP